MIYNYKTYNLNNLLNLYQSEKDLDKLLPYNNQTFLALQ